MYGAILGDMIGAPYEFDMGNKSKEFPLFCKQSQFTDDSVMTIAVAEALEKAKNTQEDNAAERFDGPAQTALNEAIAKEQFNI